MAMGTRDYIWVDEHTYRRGKYTSRCQILDRNVMNLSVLLDAWEYRYALEREQMESQYCAISNISPYQISVDAGVAANWIQQYTFSNGTGYYSEPNKKEEKKKEEKASKQIRHQYLRRRIKERVKV